MTRLNVMLLIALLASALYLVKVSYESRRLFAELDKAQSEERALDIDSERLKTELRSQATPLRVERTARDRLGMRAATPATTQYVGIPMAASSSAGSAGAWSSSSSPASMGSPPSTPSTTTGATR